MHIYVVILCFENQKFCLKKLSFSLELCQNIIGKISHPKCGKGKNKNSMLIVGSGPNFDQLSEKP